jgi:hypothetical protein
MPLTGAVRCSGAAAMVALLLVTAGGAARATTGSTPPKGLSEPGRLLWQFEALLHDTFGARPVCATGRWQLTFTTRCGALADYAPYDRVFVRARDSKFRVSQKRVCCYGNYPQPVRIEGSNIACDSSETTFLVANLGRAHFSLRCSKPG